MNAGAVAGVVIVVLALVALIGFVVGWVVYAYRNPNTSSGRWLIEVRFYAHAHTARFLNNSYCVVLNFHEEVGVVVVWAYCHV